MSCFAAAPSCQFLCAGDIALRVIANFLNVAVADPADVINLMEALRQRATFGSVSSHMCIVVSTRHTTLA
jgi:hypothetical protein